MNPKIFICTLAIIVLSFVGQGIHIVNTVEKVFDNNLIHQKSTVEDIGMVFDWYGLTIVDSVVKRSHGIITHEEMVVILKEGQVQKNHLLSRYYSSAIPEERNYVAILKESDEKLDQFVERAINTGIETEQTELIADMYALTDPTVNTINEILRLKTDYAIKNVQVVYKKLEDFRRFLYLAGVLAIVIIFPTFFPRNNKKTIIKLKQIKKRAIKEKQGI